MLDNNFISPQKGCIHLRQYKISLYSKSVLIKTLNFYCIIVEPVNRISFNQLSTFKLTIPISRCGNIFSKTFVHIKARPKNNIVNITCFQKVFPLFTESNHRSEEHTSELQSRINLVCRLLLEKKKKT